MNQESKSCNEDHHHRHPDSDNDLPNRDTVHSCVRRLWQVIGVPRNINTSMISPRDADAVADAVGEPVAKSSPLFLSDTCLFSLI
jgi:hypothetical protein